MIIFLIAMIVAIGGAVYWKMPWLLNHLPEYARTPVSTGESDEDVLRRLSSARWEALVNRDYDAVWSYATPAFRASYDVFKIRVKYAGNLQRGSHKILSIAISNENGLPTAKLSTQIGVWSEGPGGRGMMEFPAEVEELWIKRDDVWWIVEETSE